MKRRKEGGNEVINTLTEARVDVKVKKVDEEEEEEEKKQGTEQMKQAK